MRHPFPMPKAGRLVPVVFFCRGHVREVGMVRSKPFELPKTKGKS